MKTRWLVSVSGVAILAMVAGYAMGRARSPISAGKLPLTYSGVLTDGNGAPIAGPKNIQVQVWNKESGGDMICSVGPVPTELVAGAFKLDLVGCDAAFQNTSELWVEVFADGTSLKRSPVRATPYALSAERAAHDTAGKPQRICSGTTPQGATDWQVYDARTVKVTIDTSACNFTSKPLYITALGGRSNHFATTGGSAPYTVPATEKTQFELYVTRAVDTTPQDANSLSWHINWIAIGN